MPSEGGEPRLAVPRKDLLVSYADDFEGYTRGLGEPGGGGGKRLCVANTERTALQSFLASGSRREGHGAPGGTQGVTGHQRIQDCRMALACMDRQGWERSFFQRKFHDAFMQATARVFWKPEGPGQFARDHQDILERNGWDHMAQEVLISTPRRFGKTISVSMFAAAMLFSSARVEVSIYSTCKRISQKLLRNVRKFLDLVFVDLNQPGFKVLRENQEEIVLQGREGKEDIRVVNSYPSRVSGSDPMISSHECMRVAALCARTSRERAGISPGRRGRARTPASGPLGGAWTRARAPSGVPPAHSVWRGSRT